MKKEVILAILIGLVMGLFITFGFYYSQKSEEEDQTTTTIEELEVVKPTQDPEKVGKITIYNPEDEIIQEDLTTKVTGKTSANAFIVIYVNNDPIIIQADQTGNFSKEVELETLANVLRIHAVDADGNQHTEERTVIVYDEPLVTLTPNSEKEDEDNQDQDQDQETTSDDDSNQEETN